MTTYTGKCHCGQVQFSVKLDQPQHILCHCNTCKSLSTSSYTLNEIIPSSSLDIPASSASVLKTYTYTGDSGKPVHCYYCGNCTTHVYHHQTVLGDDKYVVRTILLDGAAEGFKPAAEIYGKDRMGWEGEVAKTFEVLPPE